MAKYYSHRQRRTRNQESPLCELEIKETPLQPEGFELKTGKNDAHKIGLEAVTGKLVHNQAQDGPPSVWVVVVISLNTISRVQIHLVSLLPLIR